MIPDIFGKVAVVTEMLNRMEPRGVGWRVSEGRVRRTNGGDDGGDVEDSM